MNTRTVPYTLAYVCSHASGPVAPKLPWQSACMPGCCRPPALLNTAKHSQLLSRPLSLCAQASSSDAPHAASGPEPLPELLRVATAAAQEGAKVPGLETSFRKRRFCLQFRHVAACLNASLLCCVHGTENYVAVGVDAGLPMLMPFATKAHTVVTESEGLRSKRLIANPRSIQDSLRHQHDKDMLVISAAVDQPRKITMKGATDLVTETDRLSEEAILGRGEAAKQHAFVSYSITNF
eukprot:1159060-Pelagomonas_calceolata.AAC.3